MPRETMSPRERWLAVLRREKPDRVPMDYWATQEVTDRLMAHLGCSSEMELYERLHIDYLFHVGPRYIGPPLEDRCLFGCGYKNVNYGDGDYLECVEHPLAACESVGDVIRDYNWPSFDWLDFSNLAKEASELERYPIKTLSYEPFAVYQKLRGPELAYIDLIDNPEIVHHCLDRIFDFFHEVFTRVYELIPGQLTATYIAEDLGSQEGLMYSPTQIREFFISRMRKMMTLAHEAGSYVFNHDDGAISKIIPDMLDAGMDIQNPVQWRCNGMDRETLKRDFGDRLVFHGAMDNQQTLAFGTVEDVREEVIYNLNVLGKGGGYILAPCHNIQPISPIENILAMYETGYEYGFG